MFDRLHTIWALLKGQRLRYAGALLSLIVAAGLLYAVPIVPQIVFDGVLVDEPREGSWIERLGLSFMGGRDFVSERLWIPALFVVGLTLLPSPIGPRMVGRAVPRKSPAEPHVVASSTCRHTSLLSRSRRVRPEKEVEPREASTRSPIPEPSQERIREAPETARLLLPKAAYPERSAMDSLSKGCTVANALADCTMASVRAVDSIRTRLVVSFGGRPVVSSINRRSTTASPSG